MSWPPICPVWAGCDPASAPKSPHRPYAIQNDSQGIWPWASVKSGESGSAERNELITIALTLFSLSFAIHTGFKETLPKVPADVDRQQDVRP